MVSATPFFPDRVMLLTNLDTSLLPYFDLAGSLFLLVSFYAFLFLLI
jgi:hypothetical protein